MTINRLDLLVALDVDAILNTPLSSDWQNPTGVNAGHAFMMVQGSHAPDKVVGQGTDDIEFSACIGDFIAIRAVSLDYGTRYTPVIYKAGPADNNPFVFNPFGRDTITLPDAVAPNPNQPAFPYGWPNTPRSKTFSSFDSRVRDPGMCDFLICMALYKFDPDEDDGPNAVPPATGYCYVTPTIVVNDTPISGPLG